MPKFKVGHIYVYEYPSGRLNPCLYKVTSVWDEPDTVEFKWYHILNGYGGTKTYHKEDLKHFKPIPALAKILYGI